MRQNKTFKPNWRVDWKRLKTVTLTAALTLCRSSTDQTVHFHGLLPYYSPRDVTQALKAECRLVRLVRGSMPSPSLFAVKRLKGNDRVHHTRFIKMKMDPKMNSETVVNHTNPAIPLQEVPALSHHLKLQANDRHPAKLVCSKSRKVTIQETEVLIDAVYTNS
jgi:hypothetical protein